MLLPCEFGHRPAGGRDVPGALARWRDSPGRVATRAPRGRGDCGRRQGSEEGLRWKRAPARPDRRTGRRAGRLRARAAAVPPALVDALTRGAGVAPGGRVLDLGAGTGLLSGPLLEARLRRRRRRAARRHARIARRAIGAERVWTAPPRRSRSPDGASMPCSAATATTGSTADARRASSHRVLRPGGGLGPRCGAGPTSTDAAPWVGAAREAARTRSARASGVHGGPRHRRARAPRRLRAGAARADVAFTYDDRCRRRSRLRRLDHVRRRARDAERRAALLDAVAELFADVSGAVRGADVRRRLADPEL